MLQQYEIVKIKKATIVTTNGFLVDITEDLKLVSIACVYGRLTYEDKFYSTDLMRRVKSIGAKIKVMAGSKAPLVMLGIIMHIWSGITQMEIEEESMQMRIRGLAALWLRICSQVGRPAAAWSGYNVWDVRRGSTRWGSSSGDPMEDNHNTG